MTRCPFQDKVSRRLYLPFLPLPAWWISESLKDGRPTTWKRPKSSNQHLKKHHPLTTNVLLELFLEWEIGIYCAELLRCWGLFATASQVTQTKHFHLPPPPTLDEETETQSGKLNLTRLHSWKSVDFLVFHGKFIKRMLLLFFFSFAAYRILVLWQIRDRTYASRWWKCSLKPLDHQGNPNVLSVTPTYWCAKSSLSALRARMKKSSGGKYSKKYKAL